MTYKHISVQSWIDAICWHCHAKGCERCEGEGSMERIVKVHGRIRLKPVQSYDPQDGEPAEILGVTFDDGSECRASMTETERFLDVLMSERNRLLEDLIDYE